MYWTHVIKRLTNVSVPKLLLKLLWWIGPVVGVNRASEVNFLLEKLHHLINVDLLI